MKKTLIVLFTLLLTACSTKNRDNYDTVKETKFHRTLILTKIQDITSQGYCSAGVINYKNKIRVITNSHCCTGSIVSYNGEISEIIKISTQKDLCEITPVNEKEGIRLLNKTPPHSSKIIHIGSYPFYDKIILNTIDARIIGKTRFEFPTMGFDSEVILTSREIYHGMSGGMVVYNGMLVGLNMLTFTPDRKNMAGFIPVEVIREFLDE